MSRTRLVRPGFFADEDVASMTRDSRLAYVGLWTECDDAGYFEAKPRQLARALFGFDPDGLDVVTTAIADLVRLKKVELFACGEHGIVPSLPRYAQQGGNKTFGHQSAHLSKCESELVRTRTEQVHTDAPPDPVRTSSDQSLSVPPTPAPTKVRTRTDKSRSESVSVLESGTTKKKNVLDEVVEETNEAREPVVEVDPDPFLSDPPRLGRPRASTAPPTPIRAIRPPARLEAITPKWKTPPGPCLKYAIHGNSIRIEDGLAVCDICTAEWLAANVPVNGAETPQKGLGL